MEKSFEELKSRYVVPGRGFEELFEINESRLVTFALLGFVPTVFSGERHGSWLRIYRWTLPVGFTRILEFSLTNQSATRDEMTRRAFISIRIGATTDTDFFVDTIYAKSHTVNSKVDELIISNMQAALSRLESVTSRDLDQRYIRRLTGDDLRG